MDHFARLGVFSKVSSLAGPVEEMEEEGAVARERKPVSFAVILHVWVQIFLGVKLAVDVDCTNLSDLFSQNERQVARKLKEIKLIEHFKNQWKTRNFSWTYWVLDHE